MSRLQAAASNADTLILLFDDRMLEADESGSDRAIILRHALNLDWFRVRGLILIRSFFNQLYRLLGILWAACVVFIRGVSVFLL